MNREFLLNIAFLLGINLLIKPFYIFGIDRTVQNVVGPADYGLYLSLFNFAFILGLLNDLGIQNFNNRQISQHPQLVGKYFATLVSLKLLLGVVFLLVLMAGGWLLGYTPNYPVLLLFIGLNQVLSSLVLYLRTNVSGLGYYRWDSFFSALDRLLLIGIAAYLLWFASFRAAFQIKWFVWAQTGSLALTALLVWVFLFPRVKGWRLRLRRVQVRALLRQSLPFALVVLLMTLYTRVDVIMIQQLFPAGEREAGIYAAAYRLLDAGNMLGYLSAGLLLPMFSRLLKAGGAVSELLNLSFRLLLSTAVIVSVACWFFRTELMQWLYWEADPYWGNVLGTLMLAYVAICGTYLHGTLLTANGKLGAMNRLFGVAILLNICGNLWAIPRYGAVGAAAVTVITQFAAWLGQWWLVQRNISAPIFRSTLVRWLVFLPVVTLAGWLLSEQVALGMDWKWRLLALLAGSGLIAFAAGLFPLRALLRRA